MDNKISDERKHRPRAFVLSVVLAAIAVISGVTAFVVAFNDGSITLQIVFAAIFTVSLVVLIWLLVNPDSVRARQSDEVLKLSTEMLECMKGHGLDQTSAQQICRLLVPATAAIAVAITDREVILGYAGYNESENPQGANIRTRATHDTLEDGKERVLLDPREIGLPESLHSFRINAAIIEPLVVGHDIVGTLKFYFRKPGQISQTQRSMAEGFARLLSSQIAASALEEQKKLATSMELKALQAQINPHFLFNTINTISSFIRIDPPKARDLLRDFAMFYRSTLEDSSDLIPLQREVEQVKRYFTLQTARFGEDKLELSVDIAPDVYDMMIPSFMLQPLVENAVQHARDPEKKLSVSVIGRVEDDEIVLSVRDDGKGMTQEQCDSIMHPQSETGLGIALRNVHDRMHSYFGPDSHMDVESELGKGTTVSIVLNKKDSGGYIDEGLWGTENSALKPRG